MRQLLLAFVLLLASLKCFSQNTIGIPFIFNHSKLEYRAAGQNWDAKQDKNGIMYFANNDGLLVYDGSFWRLYNLPGNIIARSLAIEDDARLNDPVGQGKIYIGGQEEFGYFLAEKNGELVYHSLKQFIPAKDRDFADVWEIAIYQEHVFFLSNKKIFRLGSNNHIDVYESTSKWRFLTTTKNGLYAFEINNSLSNFANDRWQTVTSNPTLPNQIDIRAVLDFGKDSLLLVSHNSGLFVLNNGKLTKFESPYINNIASKNISGASFVGQDKIALISNLAGCLIIDKKGKAVQSFTKREGLQNNNILSHFMDKDKNLWLGMENGVDMIAYNNSIKNIFPEDNDKNGGYASAVYQNNLYLGVSTGLYMVPLDGNKDISFTNGNFKLIEQTKGKVWNLNEVDGKLFMSHTNGAFIIQQNNASLLDASTGFWSFMPLEQQKSILAGSYDGIHLFNSANPLQTSTKLKYESSKFMAVDGNEVWMAHSYKGVYKITFDNNGKPIATAYKDSKKILSANHNHLYKIGNKIILTSDNGIFEYNKQEQDFVRSTYYENIFEHKPVSFLKQDQYGNIWFTRDKKIGVVDLSSGKARTIYIPELNDKITTWGNENITVIDSSNVLIAAEKGFFHLNYAQYKKSRYPLTTIIRNIKSTTLNNKVVWGGYGSNQSEKPTIEYKGNSLHIEFSSVLFAEQENIEYSYKLAGFDKDWSSWNYKTEKEYTNLPAGSYTFEVKCRNSVDNESTTSSFSFTILPPWYQTIWAYLLYAALFFAVLYYFYKRQQKKYKRIQQQKLLEQEKQYAEEQRQLQFQHQLEIEQNEKQIVQLKNDMLQAEIEQQKLEEQQQRLQFEHQLELEKNEKEIIQLKNEKLQTDIELKNTELASSAMHLVQKSELLTSIKEELLRLKNNAEIEKDSKDLKKMIKVIDSQLDTDQEWEQFAVHFDSVHTNYLQHLKERFPEISSSELKLCAYLRLNLSSKEIAQLMNISIRGVETSRYRLRKKLGITGDTNLYDFLMTIKE